VRVVTCHELSTLPAESLCCPLQRLQGSLPVDQQQTLAAGFGDFISAITSKLRQAADAKRNGTDGRVVIESEDVKAALDSWKQEREAA
jgi:hypothetical protein